AGLLLPALNQAKSKARAANCRSNLRQLTICVSLYGNDSQDRLPPNNSVVGFIDSSNMMVLAASLSWCPDKPRDDTQPDRLPTGVLWHYNSSAAIYHCPSDRATVAGTALFRQRSYNMSQSINGNPDPQI